MAGQQGPGAAPILAVVRAARPQFRSPHDRLAYALHAGMLVEGYSLVAVGQGAEDENAALAVEEIGTEGWNALDGAYAFCYRGPEPSGPPILLKALVLEGAFLAHATALGVDEPKVAQVELDPSEYTTGADDLVGGYKDLGALHSRLKSALDTLAPAPPQAAEVAGQDLRAGRRGPGEPQPREPSPPGLRDGPPRHVPPMPAPVPAFGMGHEDLNPFGPGGMPGGIPGLVGGGGGMLMGPGHPGFGGPGLGGMNGGGLGGGGRVPPGVPPGARFDPYGPPGVPGFGGPGPGPGRGRGRGPVGGPGHQGVHPDIMQPGRGGLGDDYPDSMFG